MNYYRRYVGDYLRDTARLSVIEHGAYNLLLDYYYADEKPLPVDKDELYLMVRAMRSEDRKAVDKVLGLFFTKEPDGYHQKRVDHEIGVSKTARDNGKGGGRPPTGSTTGDITGSKTGHGTETVTGKQTGSQTEDGGGSGHPPATNLQPPPASPQPPEQRRATPASRGSRFAGQEISEDWRHFCKSERPDLDPEFVFKTFCDYWVAVPGQKGIKADWDATWRNWVRKEGARKPAGGTPDYSQVAARIRD